jgi:hypothetical protein
MLDGSKIPDVDRANPEEFIHLFLNNSERLVEFLEHLVKVLGFADIFIVAEQNNYHKESHHKTVVPLL